MPYHQIHKSLCGAQHSLLSLIFRNLNFDYHVNLFGISFIMKRFTTKQSATDGNYCYTDLAMLVFM